MPTCSMSVGVILPRLLGSARRVVGYGQHKPARRNSAVGRSQEAQILALEAIASSICWVQGFLQPSELAHLAGAAESFRLAVEEACTQQLHALGAHSFGANPGRADRQLHRLERQDLAALPSCCASENYSVAVDMYGRLYVWGRPGWLEDSRRLGLEPSATAPAILSPLRASVLIAINGTRSPAPKIVAVSASRHAILALSMEGRLMFAQVRRKGNGNAATFELFPLNELAGKRILQLSTRFGQAFAVDDVGQVYAWGLPTGDPGRPEMKSSMGFGKITTTLYPTPLDRFGMSGIPVRYVATGACHTIFVSAFGEAYVVGSSDSGKLGLGQNDRCQVLSPEKICFPSRNKPCIISAAAGFRHSLFLASNGEVWGCGEGRYGQLAGASQKSTRCLPSRSSQAALLDIAWRPVLLPRLNAFCTSIAAGIATSFFVTEFGHVLFCGMAVNQQEPFGRSELWHEAKPYKIPGLKNILQVSVSMEFSAFKYEHALFQQKGGALFAWGHSAHGELQVRETKGEIFHSRAVRVEGWPLPRSSTA
eukprot:TRINITY_DN29986_c0_g1_i1.p1 TRINITY_DN29986_c0_g1~~TRINITY_DN29986_c0_g1_i1.p1  ORF type:complete len:545 (-),score=88.01 TRINITY_DN29986_c0_g1_i1:51-1661(-)